MILYCKMSKELLKNSLLRIKIYSSPIKILVVKKISKR